MRDARTAAQELALYASTYPQGYRHDVWPDHVERVAASVEMIRRYMGDGKIRTVADLSCGDAAIACQLPGLTHLWLGDLQGTPRTDPAGTTAAVYPLLPGPLPDSLGYLPEPVDLYICSETIEHMDDPDELLREIAGVATYLFLSTPLSEAHNSGNVEHYWSWGQADMHQMLQDAGWQALELKLLVPESTKHMDGAYTYQLWMAVSR